MNHLRISVRLTLILLVLTVPVAVLLRDVVRGQDAQIRTARGTEACPINAQGWAKIDQGKITIQQILDDPVTNARYLKNDTAFTGSSAGAGTMFNPDGATTSAADHFRVILLIDGGGRYRVVTAYPEP